MQYKSKSLPAGGGFSSDFSVKWGKSGVKSQKEKAPASAKAYKFEGVGTLSSPLKCYE